MNTLASRTKTHWMLTFLRSKPLPLSGRVVNLPALPPQHLLLFRLTRRLGSRSHLQRAFFCFLLKICHERALEWMIMMMTFADWCSLIRRSFEHHFCIPEDKAEDASYAIGSLSPWARGVYKDCLGCEDEWCMLQLRPNQTVAMAVAPFLFDADHARVSQPLTLCISCTFRLF